MGYASKSGRARTSSSNPQAHAICDRCGFRYNWVDLRWQFDWRGASLQNLRILVCKTCYDKPQEQLRAIVVPADPTPIINARTQDFVTASVDDLTANFPVVTDPTTGIPIPSQAALVTQDLQNITTQPIGTPSGNGLTQSAIMPLIGTVHYDVPVPVLAINSDGTTFITVTCLSPHNLITGSQISVEGLLNPLATGFYSVVVISATAFTYQVVSRIPAASLLTDSTKFVTASIGLPYNYQQIPLTQDYIQNTFGAYFVEEDGITYFVTENGAAFFVTEAGFVPVPTPPNPLPSLSTLIPSGALQNSGAFSLSIVGSNFIPSSVANWNGIPLSTTYVSSIALSANIPSNYLTSTGTALVTVASPAPGGGTSNALPFTISTADNPVPTLSSLSPANAFSGSPDTPLTVGGSNFLDNSIILWNGSVAFPTTYVDSATLTAVIPAADLISAGSAAVTVFNPAPGGGTSSPINFAINNPVSTGDLIFQQTYDLVSAVSPKITSASYSGSTATIVFSTPNSGSLTPIAGMTVTVQGVDGATGYNGTYIVTGGTSTTVQYTLPTAPTGTPTYTNAYVTIIQCYCLTDTNGNNPNVGTAFSAPILVQGGTAPYAYSFYKAPQATTTSSPGYVGSKQNVWTIDSATGVVSGTPEITEADIIYVQVTDSASNTITTEFVIGVLTAGVGTGEYTALSGTALRDAIFANTPVGTVSIPSWLTTAPSGFTIQYPTAPNTITAGQQTVTPLTSYVTVVNIPGGTTPFTCLLSNCHYVLQGDLSCPAVCISVRPGTSNILIDLNGYTLTYGTSNVQPATPNSIDSCGIGYANSYSPAGTIEIINGRIQNGAGRTTNMVQGLYGISACPLRLYQLGTTTLYLRGLYFKYNNYSCGALGISQCSITNTSLVENCSFEDYGWIVQNRTVGCYVTGYADVLYTIRNNKFMSARHICIGPSINTYENEIWVDGWATNSTSISVETVAANGVPGGQQIYNNNIYFTGVHPQSCFVGAPNLSTGAANIYSNWMEGTYSRVGNQAPSATGGLDDYENFADGLTMKFGDPKNNNIYQNMMWTHAKSATVWNPKINVYQNSTARGLYYYGAKPDLVNNNFTANMMAATTADYESPVNDKSTLVLGTSGYGGGLNMSGNRMVTNRLHFYMADAYGYFAGFAGPSQFTGNYIELQEVASSRQYDTFSNGAELVYGTFPITSASSTGTVVTIAVNGSVSMLGYGSPLIVSGIVGGTGFNGTFPASSVISSTTTQIVYSSVTTGTPTSVVGATYTGQVVVSPTFTSNTWVNGSWAGSSTPANYTIVGNTSGASGTTPVRYSRLGPNMTYTLINEPGAIL